MTELITIETRDYVQKPPTSKEIINLFWERIVLGEQIDVDEIVYGIIGDFDHHFEDEDGTYKAPSNSLYCWYNDDDTDEKDSLRDEVLDAIGFYDYQDGGDLLSTN